jgi:rhamnulose-1-phosphate aldolase
LKKAKEQAMDNQNTNQNANYQAEPNIFDRGVAKVRSAVSEISIEQRTFTKAFVRMVNDGFAQGWHEDNGGNLSYRMSVQEVTSCRSSFNKIPGKWVDLNIQAQGLAGEYFMVSAAGKHFRTLSLDPAQNIGILEINQAGNAWRLVWGFNEGASPTSEFFAHFMAHAVRKVQTQGIDRVIYHAHPTNAIALLQVVQNDVRSLSRILWGSLSETILTLASGVGVSRNELPGSIELARKTSALAEKHNAVLWPYHGLICFGADFDHAFGLVHSIEKASQIYLQARASLGGNQEPVLLTGETIVEIAKNFKVEIALDYL